LIYEQKLKIQALEEDLKIAFDDSSEKDKLITRLEAHNKALNKDNKEYMGKIKKLTDKNESFKSTNMELRRRLQDVERQKQGNDSLSRRR
jgi:chromosome segregation ATPase